MTVEKVLSSGCAILATAIGCGASLALLVLVMASLANSTPAQLTAGKRWMLVIAVGGFLTLATAVWLLVVGRPWTSALVGGFPLVAMIGLFIWVEVSK